MAGATPVTSSIKSRLTFEPGATRGPLSQSADIPAFSHPSSQSDTRRIKPLPKPVQEKAKSNTDARRSSSRGEPSWRARKRLQKEEEERRKREGPLEEAEEGEYDHHGIWQAKQPQEDPYLQGNVPAENKANTAQADAKDPVGTEAAETLRPKTNHWDGDYNAIAQELQKMQDMPSDGTFADFFTSSQVHPASQQPPSPPDVIDATIIDGHVDPLGRVHDQTVLARERLEAEWARLGPNKIVRSAPNPRRLEAPGDLEEENVQYTGIHRQSPDIPMPPSAQRQRSISLPALPPHSRLRYTAIGDCDTDTDEEGDLEGSSSHASPTELDSPAVSDPVNRSMTRRSNSHRQVYSLAPEEEDAVLSLRWFTQAITDEDQSDTVGNSLQLEGMRTSFPVSQSDIPTQLSDRVEPSRMAQPRTVATYSKSRPRTSISSRIDRGRPRDHIGFRDQFSPEPEWEAEQQRQRRELERTRTKRHGSTSLWPASEAASDKSTTSTVYVDDHWRDSALNREEDGEQGEAHERQPLREIEVNEQGRRKTRGRGRNGAWPEERGFGLFDQDSQERGRGMTQPLRPVSERLHLVRRDKAEDDEDEDEPRLARSKKGKIKALPDPYTKHPLAKLKLRPDTLQADDMDGFRGHRGSVRDRYDRLPYIPGLNATSTRGRKRKNELNDLPDYVLKPIDKISINDYKKQVKDRLPGDGFVNPQLIKSGRLASRDTMLRAQKRLRGSKKMAAGRQAEADWQTLIRGDDGEPDPIVPPTQTQRVASDSPDISNFDGGPQRPRHRQPTKRIASRPRLAFTATSPRPIADNDSRTPLPFTSRTPPPRLVQPPSTQGTSNRSEEVKRPIPAEDVPGLMPARIGFINRLKRKHASKQAGQEDATGGSAQSEQAPAREGFIKRVPGFWAPEAAVQGDWIMTGSPAHSHAGEPERGPEPLFLSSSQDHSASRQENAVNQPNERKQTPLFLPHDPETVSTPAHAPSDQASTSTNMQSSSRMSGAQLCNDLLHRVALQDLPTKSNRDTKRKEMAKRVARKTVKTSGSTLSFISQAKALGMPVDEVDEGQHEPRPSQIRRMDEMAGFRVQRQATASTATGIDGNGSAQSQASETPVPTRNASTDKSSAPFSDQGPPGNQQALMKQRTIAKTRSAVAKGFQAPRPIRPVDTSRPSSSGHHGPRWATDNELQ